MPPKRRISSPNRSPGRKPKASKVVMPPKRQASSPNTHPGRKPKASKVVMPPKRQASFPNRSPGRKPKASKVVVPPKRQASSPNTHPGRKPKASKVVMPPKRQASFPNRSPGRKPKASKVVMPPKRQKTLPNRSPGRKPKVCKKSKDGTYDKKGPLSFLTHLEYKDLLEANTSAEGVDKILEIIQQRGSPACEKFLDHLNDIVLGFPALKDASQDLERLLKREKVFHDLVESMKMSQNLTSKLTLRNILSVGLEDLHDKKPETIEDLSWNYLRKVMALNRTARDNVLNNQLTVDDDDGKVDDDDDFSLLEDESNSSSSIHPLDVLCVLLHCSDRFLQQEIITKMSMCQFAIPMLLPMGDGLHYILMLWAMRDIVKKWRPQSLASSKGFNEENVVNVSMPIFSFVKLGKNKLSKSKILNQVLNPPQQNNNFFIHDNMDGGNLERKISDGLVEMSWYFPSGKSDVFPEPIAVTNLRGDLESHWDQFWFLTRVSSAVFIFMESMSEREFTLLSTCNNTDTQYYFIVTPGPGRNVSTETQKVLQDLKPKLNLKKTNVIKYGSKDNEAAFVKQLQGSIVALLNNGSKINIMRNLVDDTHGLHIYVDEISPECQEGWQYSCKITEEITNVAEYKQKTMMLQRDPWKNLSKIEKELCRMTNQGNKDTQHYQDKLRRDIFLLREEQYSYDLPNGIMHFMDAIMNLSNTEKQYFLKWMKFQLDAIARNQLSALQAAYKEKSSNTSTDKEELKHIDQRISNSSLGIEHFLREIGQYYEAECSMIKENKITQTQLKFTGLPGTAADLLIDGFPLELIDGDVSNIPMHWITNVLTDLDKKTGRKSRIRVITVLGVQSTGKSTLLNTMFGLQFPVSSGRCTRGAFMTLIKVKENFQEELGCEFIMVIDTEGLKAPELASLEGSYEHDNELATLVVGLSDITIVNMAMENTTEMKDILQIVVHAFLRMKEVGKKPSCQFVHQNVSDVSAHEKNMRDRKKLLEQLNEMTKVAAEMEKKSGITTFSDVMDYDLEKDNWYIPGLWLGVPPMAPVNSGYSEHVYELKKYLLELLKNKNSLQKPLMIPEFITWIESLWNAVKHEKFIFSFRNSLVAEAYNNLSIQFSQWEWDFRKSIHDWLIRTETSIKNQSFESLNEDLCLRFQTELMNLIHGEKDKMLKSLENYFSNKNENVHLIERYKKDFVLSTETLSKELERNALSKCDETISIKKGKFKIQDIQSRSQKLIEDKITDLLKRCQERNQQLSEEELENEFTAMWEKTLNDLQIKNLRKQIVGKSVLQQLRNDMSNKGSAINEELLRMENIENHAQQDFIMEKKYIDSGWLQWLGEKLKYHKNEPYDKIKEFALSLIDKCDTYVNGKVSTAEDYNDTYCQEILHMINTELSKEVKALRFSSQFELDIKLHILGKASREFQKMHDSFIKENDPKLCLGKLKPQYLETFLITFQDKDVCQTKAREFCKRCLKPAITAHVFQRLGTEIVQDILHSSDNKTFNSRTFFQCFLLKELLEEPSFWNYVKYIRSYEKYAKAWILMYIEKKYKHAESLKTVQKCVLSALTKKIKAVLANSNCLVSPSVADFLKCVCEMLNTELVIPQNELNVVTFQNTASVQQFSSDIQLLLEDTETQILSKLQSMDITSVLSKVTVKPVDELCRKVVGCGKQCPFCKVPCEGAGDGHTSHFASIHRSQGLGRYRSTRTRKLVADVCTTEVVSTDTFHNSDTEGKYHPYKDYRKYYPDWSIQPDPSLESSDYWKYIFVRFNDQFAEEYDALPADIPAGWKSITKEKVLDSLKKTFND